MLAENIKLALHSLAANKLRTFLTMLGIMIGIAAVVAIYTLGTSQTKTYEQQQASNGINNIEISIYSDSQDTLLDSPVYFTQELLDKMFQHYEGQIAAISFQAYGDSGKVYVDESKIETNYNSATTLGISRGTLAVENLSLVAGRNFSASEENNAASVCILSDLAVKYLFDGDATAAVGSTIHFRRNNDEDDELRVIGVYAFKRSNAASVGAVAKEQDVTCYLYVPYSYVVAHAGEQMASYWAKPNSITLQVVAGGDVIEISDDLQSWLPDQFSSEYHAVAGIYNNKSGIEEARQSMQAQARTTAMIAAIALLVGGIGVMNIMTVTITERTREIGTRKALGAKSKDIRQQFVVESAVMSLIGGTIGMVAGFIGGVIGCRMMNYTLAIPWEAVIGSFVISLLIGIFFGYYPADRAAKLDPIEALRYE